MLKKRPGILLSALALAGCADGFTPYHGPDSVIATGQDRGAVDQSALVNGEAAIAYDPDGCQVWIIDDGVEGYASRRYDPVSGLPVCNDLYPPGTVIGNYQTSDTGFRDYVPGHGVRTVVVGQ